MSIITLTTDFGSDDHYVAAMKGVILSINPNATIVDITHTIPPQDIRAGAWALLNAAPYFPVGTVHVCVVDPGVGSERRPIALELDCFVGNHGYRLLVSPIGAQIFTPSPSSAKATQFFVGPDNGVLCVGNTGTTESSRRLPLNTVNTPDANPLTPSRQQGAVHLTNSKYWRHAVSRTFHGRDIFAPVAAHLSLGVPLRELGEPLRDITVLTWHTAQDKGDLLVGEIVHIDRFGNCITNIYEWRVADGRPRVEIGDTVIEGICKTYAEAEHGALLALVGSSGYLELAVRDGNAAERLGVKVGDEVRVRTNNQG
jgi:hypothetical protein